MRTIIEGGTIVNEGRTFDGTIIIEDGTITAIVPVGTIAPKDTITPDDEVIDAKGCYILPGIIDDHVHFREPGLTEKADIDTESRAAAAGGVTTFFDMPNTNPQTTTLEALEQKFSWHDRRVMSTTAFSMGRRMITRRLSPNWTSTVSRASNSSWALLRAICW